MAKIVFVCEQANSRGPIIPHLPLLARLCSQGHELHFILRNTTQSYLISPHCEGRFYQSPLKSWDTIDPIETPSTYTEILYNRVFDGCSEVTTLISQWNDLFRAINPNLILFEHSVASLLSARILNLPSLSIANGFATPPNLPVLPGIHPRFRTSRERIERIESKVLSNINKVLEYFKSGPIDYVSDLIPVNRIVKSIEELDPYDRHCERMISFPVNTGESPKWPDGPGKKVFCYFDHPQGLNSIISILVRLRLPSLIMATRLSQEDKDAYTCSTIKFVDQTQNMVEVLEQCDLGITNSTLNISTNFILAGKPTLNIPVSLEQLITANGLVHRNLGTLVDEFLYSRISMALKGLLDSDFFFSIAKSYPSCYSNITPESQLNWLDKYINSML